MGIIRGVLLVLVSVTLFLSLFCTAIFWTLGSSLEYEHVQKESIIVLGNLLDSTGLTTSLGTVIPIMQLYCANNSGADYVFTEAGYTLSVSCASVMQGEEAILNNMVLNLVDFVYYTNYDNCDFWDCGDSSGLPLFLISEKAHEYWTAKFYLLLLISLILAAASFVLIEKKTNLFIIAGIFSVIVSIPFLNINLLFGLFSDPTISGLLNIFLSQAFNVALYFLISGIALIILGIIFKIFKIGFFISNLLSKFQKKENKPLKTKSK